MTPKDYGVELINQYLDLTPVDYSLNDTAAQVNEKALNDFRLAVDLALIDVRNTIKALEDYGRRTDELQNMEREFAWWDKVEKYLMSKL